MLIKTNRAADIASAACDEDAGYAPNEPSVNPDTGKGNASFDTGNAERTFSERGEMDMAEGFENIFPYIGIFFTLLEILDELLDLLAAACTVRRT